MKLKKGDKVVIMAGKSRGESGTILRALPRKNLIVVEGVNVVKKHQRRSSANRKGQIIDRPMPIDASNVMIVDPKSGKPTRIKIQRQAGGGYMRVAVKSGHAIK